MANDFEEDAHEEASAMYASPESEITEYALVRRNEKGEIDEGILCFLSEECDSPSGWSWYFGIYGADDRGNLVECEGGTYWGYETARACAEDVFGEGEAVSFEELEGLVEEGL